MTTPNHIHRLPTTARRGHTLLEVMVVSTIMGIFITIPIPMFAKAIEQSKLDMATSNLRAIWCAQRYFFLENGRYGSLAELSPSSETPGTALLDPSIIAGETFYAYAVDIGSGQSFTATAQHPAGGRCSGSISIDHTGNFSSQVVYATSSGNVAMTPSLEPRS